MKAKSLLVQSAPAILFILCAVMPHLAHAAGNLTAIIPDVASGNKCVCVGSAPDWQCALQLFQTVQNDFVIFVTTMLTVFLAWAGITYIMNPTSPEKRSQANARLRNAIIGLMIVLSAWLLVDTVMKTLYNSGSGWGPWNTILTGTGPDGSDTYCIIVQQNPGTLATAVSQLTGGTTGTGSTGGTGTGSSNPTSSPYTGSGFTYQSGIQAQTKYESAALASMLSCMAGKVPAGVGQISSIADSVIANGSKTFAQCATDGDCSHTTHSCHYGGRTCVGSSYAVDFGDENNSTALMAAGKMCGSSAAYFEGNHVHISVGAASGCGCDN